MTDDGADTAPLQEIGEVIFADFFRQSYAGESRGATQWKLASYEVAGGEGQNESVLEARWIARRLLRPFRTKICWGRYQTLRVWLISGCPCRDDYLPSWCANPFPDGRRRGQRRRGSSSLRSRGWDICGRLPPNQTRRCEGE